MPIIEYTDDEILCLGSDGTEYLDKEQALALLLWQGVLLCNGRQYVEHMGKERTPYVAPETTVLFVLCSDTFAYACADAEELPYSKIGELYKLWRQNADLGPTKWCALRRKQKPIAPLVDALKAAGLWDDEMEQLSDNLCA